MTSHLDPPLNVNEIAFPSVRLCGKLLPSIVRIVPPYGFRAVLGVTDDTTMLITTSATPLATGMMPNSSVTTGAQEPATAVTSQVREVPAVTTTLVQSMFENLTDLMEDGRLVPVIVRVVPE